MAEGLLICYCLFISESQSLPTWYIGFYLLDYSLHFLLSRISVLQHRVALILLMLWKWISWLALLVLDPALNKFASSLLVTIAGNQLPSVWFRTKSMPRWQMPCVVWVSSLVTVWILTYQSWVLCPWAASHGLPSGELQSLTWEENSSLRSASSSLRSYPLVIT